MSTVARARYVLTDGTMAELGRLRAAAERLPVEKGGWDYNLDLALRRLAEDEPPPPDCPSWCNHHTWDFSGALSNDDPVDSSAHIYRVPFEDSDIMVALDDGDGPLAVHLPGTGEYTIAQARALADALTAACDAVEGAE